MGKAEAHVEKYLKRRVEEAGGLCYKFTSGDAGVPDRVIILKGLTVFVETKAPQGRAEERQLAVHRQMRGRGAHVEVLYTRDQVDEYMQRVFPSTGRT